MKHQFFLQILTSTALLIGINADNLASAQFSEEKLIAPVDEMLSQAPSSACEGYDLLEGLVLKTEQERFARAALDRYDQAFNKIADRAESEGRDFSDAEEQALNVLVDDLFTRLEQELSPEQIQRLHFNYNQTYSFMFVGIGLTPEQGRFARAELYRYEQAFNEIADRVWAEERDFSDAEEQAIEALDDDLFIRLEQELSPEQVQQVRANFDPVPFLDEIELTSEQDQFFRAELDRYDQAINEMFERAESEGRDISEAEYQALDDEFFTRLERGLSPEQVQQIRNDFDPLYGMFDDIELTPEQDQFFRTELDRYDQAINEMFERAESESRDISEAEYQAIDDEFFTRLERGLSPEQVQQVRDDFDPLYGLFDDIELTPKQDQFVRAELDRYDQAFNEIMDRVESEDRDFSDTEIQSLEALDDEFLNRLEQGLSPEQVQQVRAKFNPIEAPSLEEACPFGGSLT